ncbi:MAG: glycosyltransferase 87 family protein [Propioniciclava sp.]|uniref:glycosyltransferase 87 family protein n=1 Tax=Propioniciclava sp. TaxID=2038686 RepID=UPI0039E2665F
MSADPRQRAGDPRPVVRALGGVLLFGLPMLAGLVIAGVTIPGSSLLPWRPAMIDLDVYLRTGSLLLQGRDFYDAEGLPWIYPPFAALFTVPLALVPQVVAQVCWIAITVALLMAMLHRLGLSGWRLSLAAAATIGLVEPVRETMGFGQLGVLLVSLAVLDTMPGRRLLPRRVLPEGTLVGLATAVKLTPATVAAYQFFAGRRKPGLVAFFTFLGATGLAFLVLPQGSLHYWGGLISGDSGINSGIIFKTNQSVMGVWARLFGELSRGGLIASVLVAVAGIACAVLVHRAGHERLAIVLAGYTSLLASPISWSHHYVWVVPLAMVLLTERQLARSARILGLAYVAWTVVAPFRSLPGGNGEELTYTPLQHLLANGGVALGVAFVLWCGLLAARRAGDSTALSTGVLR